MMKTPLYLLAASSLVSQSCSEKNNPEDKKLPNVIIILCDDLGYGDIGCFGATDIKTPNIDNIAAQGIKFTEFYSASPVSSPSRAGLLTGRMPQRMGINTVFFPESFTGMSPNEITIAEMLKEKGYATGIVGKWHLGHHHQYLPLQQGFDEYFGIPYSNDMAGIVYMRGNEVETFNVDQHYLTKTYTEEAIKYIEGHKDRPFFLYLAHNMPHVPIYASEKFQGTSERGLYGDVVQEIDWSIGEIIKKIEETGLTENTLLIFTSDNGPWLAMKDHGGSAGFLREGKQYTFEGGMRVPTVAMWPGTIQAGTVDTNMALMMDIFPTLAEITGYEVPKNLKIDGKSILPVLTGKGSRENQEYLYYNMATPECYRSGDWKYKKAFDGFEGNWWKQAVAAHPELLINLKNDPGEQHNLADSLPEQMIAMKQKFQAAVDSMGELPASLLARSPADESHIKRLKELNESKKK